MDRRTLLRGGLAGAGAVAIGATVGCAPMPGRPPEDLGVWDCGVASGLHDASAAVLWTRFAPAAVAAAELDWQVAADPGFTTIVAQGRVRPGPETDGCAKVLAQDLPAGSTLWYRFAIDGLDESDRPHAGACRGRHCPRWSPSRSRELSGLDRGRYESWEAIAAADLDAVLFLGDYIYEGGGAPDRSTARPPRRDGEHPRRLSGQVPDVPLRPVARRPRGLIRRCRSGTITSSATTSTGPDRGGAPAGAAAYQAWFEYMPVWPSDGTGSTAGSARGPGRHLDARHPPVPRPRRPSRSPAIPPAWGWGRPSRAMAPDRTLLGGTNGTGSSTIDVARDDGVPWKLIGNQVMIPPWRVLDLDTDLRAINPNLPRHDGVYLGLDSWDGYLYERDPGPALRTMDHHVVPHR